MIPVIVVRPEPGCAATVSRARGEGLPAQGFPLFSVAPRAWQAPPRATFDALLIGSANALRHAGPALEGYRGAPVYPVGAATAHAARGAGLDLVCSGEGGLQDLLARLDPAHRRLLRLAGAERVPLTVPDGVAVDERVVYEVLPQPLPSALIGVLGGPALILLHSAAAARHFAAECTRLGIDRGRLVLATIGARVSDAAGPGWRAVARAPRPDDTALLALAREMCQTLAQ